MKVLLVNGSPHQNGCTHTALAEAAAELNRLGIETQELWVGNKPIRSCIGCGGCFQEKKCVFDEDRVNECVQALKEADGLIAVSYTHLDVYKRQRPYRPLPPVPRRSLPLSGR